MRTFHPMPALTLALCCTLGLVSRAGAEIANGGFEAGPAIPPTSGSQAVPPGSAALTSWSVIGGSVTIVTDGYWAPYSGHRSLALSASGPGGITQSFASSAGAAYRLVFWLTGEPFTTPTLKHLRVQAGSVTQDYTYDITPAWHWDMHWAEQTLDFAGTGSTTALTFTSQDAGNWGPVIDSVRVEAVTVGVTTAPLALALAPVAPDPLRGTGRISFTLPSPRAARLSVYDVQGREIARLADGVLDAGPHERSYSPDGAAGRAGLYFLVLRAGEDAVVRRFAVLP